LGRRAGEYRRARGGGAGGRPGEFGRFGQVGLAGGADIVHAGWSPRSGAVAAEEILQRPHLPTALVVVNAVTASGVLSTLRDAWVRVPEEIWVVTIHDAWFVEHLAVALTAVRLSLHQLGSTAATLLIDAIDGRSPETNTFITEPAPELVLRRSTDHPPSREG